MTEEKLKRGQELLTITRQLKNSYENWQNANSIHLLELETSRGTYYSGDKRWVNFDDLKLLALAKISKRLEEVQTEFDNL